MSITYKQLSSAEQSVCKQDSVEVFALDVLMGLSETPKRLSSKYFYDDFGSDAFQQIMDLPEYYLTNCEHEILATQQKVFDNYIGSESFNLVELGAGDGRKTRVLLDFFLQRGYDFSYVPIDISESAMQSLTELLKKELPSLNVLGLIADYFDALKWLQNNNRQRNVVLFLGSNLGNFNKAQARSFLRHMWNTLNDGDYVVIGFDLKKDIDLMIAAYNDSQKVTSQFNLNLLKRINQELGGNFDLTTFRHYSTYDVFTGAMESYLVSQKRQKVFIKRIGCSFDFEAWEPIHTEYSYKYLVSDIEELAENTGFEIARQLYDSKHYFVDSVWRVKKISS